MRGYCAPNKWLDLSCLVRGLLAPDHEIGTIYYFTSIITPYPHDAAAIENQNVYLQALATDPLVRIVKGKELNGGAAKCLENEGFLKG